MADYNALFAAPNAGASFAQGFQQGQQQRQSNLAKSAMAALVTDPTNQRALQALASVDPGAAEQFQQQRLSLVKQQLAQHQENILRGAQIIRELQPKDDASWQHALQVAAQAGVDVSQVPQHFDPQYVNGIVSIADAFKPEQADPGIIREFDTATQRGLVPQGTTFEQYVQMRNPGMLSPVTIPANATVTSGGGNLPRVSDQASYDAVPPGGQYVDPNGQVRTKGGATGSAPSHTFPQ